VDRDRDIHTPPASPRRPTMSLSSRTGRTARIADTDRDWWSRSMFISNPVAKSHGDSDGYGSIHQPPTSFHNCIYSPVRSGKKPKEKTLEP
jgi:hypothetical protein